MDVKCSQVLVFSIGGQSLFDYDIDLDESSEQGNKSKVQNIISRCHLQCLTGIRIGLLNTQSCKYIITKQLDPRSSFKSSIMQATLSAMKMF